jgi:soluble lytic murein transglycosylase-like protein
VVGPLFQQTLKQAIRAMKAMKGTDRTVPFGVLLAMLVAPAFAGEYAVLTSGMRMHVDRHEADAGVVRLYSQQGFMEVPESAIERFETDDYIPPPPPPPAPVPVAEVKAPPRDPRTILRDAAGKYALPAAFVESVAKVESGMKNNAVSPKGAIGVMQLMPGTAKMLAADPNDPEQNIDAGTRLLRELLIKYNGDVAKALAAYNAGSGAVDKYNGVPPYSETQNYVGKVIQSYQQSGGH